MNRFETKTGFSIELINWRLEYRGTHEDLPLYESLGGEVTAIAIVDKPAVGLNSIAEEETKMLYGIVMQPDLRIFRNMGPNGPENCYWYFSAETIEMLQQNFKGEIKNGH
ncbi:hypothetical protein [Flavobacterium daemonense]|uniref:hypothetical protein n=1 Tax=Flavobacterium daemonense TaxID=1393049 RepID=UPI001186F7E4|nr:hypothetical protein [Flavobacterium daemonense]KAF2336359.1 hypothetical protein FND99_03505 [Flavobacterium daemonense]